MSREAPERAVPPCPIFIRVICAILWVVLPRGRINVTPGRPASSARRGARHRRDAHHRARADGEPGAVGAAAGVGPADDDAVAHAQRVDAEVRRPPRHAAAGVAVRRPGRPARGGERGCRSPRPRPTTRCCCWTRPCCAPAPNNADLVRAPADRGRPDQHLRPRRPSPTGEGLLDAWGRDIVFMPRGTRPSAPPLEDLPFFFSAGPDGRYRTLEDNVYSYEVLGTDRPRE